ncbi:MULTISPECIES: hypothetical protein [unclassified Streptomyces]|uniref:hypothetical protein n=1 Tax=unclassified Streptomyces TaxID=2593676 RepID=UPI002DD80106|nr:hypothetical protein [Streptomyces sp. NBC_01768]WSC32338.1 hypothetical protein OG902_39770 [Streptomyces sp. NBC_01768]WSX06384.1 hypothetical protein OG355_41410 [Streptomyces sp. NBC_00987]
MDRIYTNHRHGERRIHIEIDENEIADLLDDIDAYPPDAFDATKRFIDILRESHDTFGTDRQADAAEAETSRT